MLEVYITILFALQAQIPGHCFFWDKYRIH